MSDKNKDCPCPYKSCARNGDCEKCNTYHSGDTYCAKNPPKEK